MESVHLLWKFNGFFQEGEEVAVPGVILAGTKGELYTKDNDIE